MLTGFRYLNANNWRIQVVILQTKLPAGKVTAHLQVDLCSLLKDHPGPQSLYFADNYSEHAGKFKEMANILAEQGFKNTSKIQADCIGFKCEKWQQIVAAVAFSTTSPTLLKLSLFLRHIVRLEDYKLFSYQDSTVSLMLLSNAGLC